MPPFDGIFLLLFRCLLSTTISGALLFVFLRFTRVWHPQVRLALCWSAVAGSLISPLVPHPYVFARPYAVGLEAIRLSPWIVGAWIVAIAVLMARYASAQFAADGIRCRATPVEKDFPMETSVPLLTSNEIRSPAVFGVLKPAILIPAAHQLSPEELRMILSHETAHIRRGDPMLNCFLNLLGVLLCFCPGVWWMCGQVRKERENACDDMALASGGSALVLSQALLKVAEQCCNRTRPLVCACGGLLENRVRRMLTGRTAPLRKRSLWIALLLLAAAYASVPEIPGVDQLEKGIRRVIVRQEISR
jgi:beta-lactamase regulating signal transducer with metallopeptidase domain